MVAVQQSKKTTEDQVFALLNSGVGGGASAGGERSTLSGNRGGGSGAVRKDLGTFCNLLALDEDSERERVRLKLEAEYVRAYVLAVACLRVHAGACVHATCLLYTSPSPRDRG